MNKTAVWPYDIVKESKIYAREDPNQLRCFLICPFKPKDIFDDLYGVVQNVCFKVGQTNSCKIICIRADKISSAGVIPTEIWDEILSADFIIADVTGINGNVMLELGVTSACREKDNVIIIKEDIQEDPILFDIGSARHIIYNRTYSGYNKLISDLYLAIVKCITVAPYNGNYKDQLQFPLEFDSKNGFDQNWLICPSMLHRKLTSSYLEFGSLFVFRNSWLSIANLEFKNFELVVEMQFTNLRESNDQSWIGISVRNNGVFANFGHLLYLNNRGELRRTVPQDEIHYEDEKIGVFKNFNLKEIYRFKIIVNDEYMSMYINEIGNDYTIANMPFVYSSGKILFQTFNARVGVSKIELKI
jgi:hypothetical protein